MATLRPAVAADSDAIATLIRELATFEKLGHEAQATGDAIRRNLFGPRPFAEAVLVEQGGEIIGFALFFHNFSTFRGEPGLYLEDLYVRPEHRGQGFGTALLQHLARLAVERGCERMEWAVLDWNDAALQFYRSLGARPMDDWTICRVDETALRDLAKPLPHHP